MPPRVYPVRKPWGARSQVPAHALAAHPGGGASFDALVTMLDDPDTAGIEVAVQSLAVPGGTPGLIAVLTALAAAEDNAGYHSRARLTQPLALDVDDPQPSVKSQPAAGLDGGSGWVLCSLARVRVATAN